MQSINSNGAQTRNAPKRPGNKFGLNGFNANLRFRETGGSASTMHDANNPGDVKSLFKDECLSGGIANLQKINGKAGFNPNLRSQETGGSAPMRDVDIPNEVKAWFAKCLRREKMLKRA